jgi:arylsulfatase A-like enzyme
MLTSQVMQINLKNLLSAAPLAVLLLVARGFGADRPNILFIMTDSLRWDNLHCAGHPLVKTPNLDKLASEGRLFNNAYSAAPVCCPARRSLFSGRYSFTHGVTANFLPANDSEIMLPSVLKFYGYTTAIAGKLHFFPPRYSYDFDYFWAGAEQDEGPGKLEPFRQYLKRSGVMGKAVKKSRWPDDAIGRGIHEYPYPKEYFPAWWETDRSIEFLKQQKNLGKPWFMFASFEIPHGPYTSPEPYYSMYDPAKMNPPPIPEGTTETRANRKGDELKKQWIDDEQMLRACMAQYLGFITLIDDCVGRLLGELDRLGMADNTLIVFHSDHGDMQGDRGRMYKSVMWEGSVHVPLIIKSPKTAAYAREFNTGKPIHSIVGSMDIMPTLLDMAGLPVPAPPGMQGQNMLPMALGKDPGWRNYAVAKQAGAMIRTERYKLIQNGNYVVKETNGREQITELYDMVSDPKEQRNLAGLPEMRRVVEELSAKLERIIAERPKPWALPGMKMPDYAVLDPEARARANQETEQLKAKRSR